MKTSAKITTVTFLAAMALGAASLTGGCTVNSTTSTDTDGGTSSSGGSSSGGSSGSTTTDGGDAGETCDTTAQAIKYPLPCQACTENSCCSKINDCFGQAAPDGGVDCNGYAECVSTCEEGSDSQKCIDDQCKGLGLDPNDPTKPTLTSQEIITAYDILAQCQLSSCETVCFE